MNDAIAFEIDAIISSSDMKTRFISSYNFKLYYFNFCYVCIYIACMYVYIFQISPGLEVLKFIHMLQLWGVGGHAVDITLETFCFKLTNNASSPKEVKPESEPLLQSQ